MSIGRLFIISENNLKSEEDDKQNADLRSWQLGRKYSTILFYPLLILALITWTGYVVVPTKKDCLLIIAGGAVGNFMTTDTSAKQLPADVTKFLHMSLQNEIKNVNDDVKRELGVQTKKEKIIDNLKDLSKEELIDYLKSDSIIINE